MLLLYELSTRIPPTKTPHPLHRPRTKHPPPSPHRPKPFHAQPAPAPTHESPPKHPSLHRWSSGRNLTQGACSYGPCLGTRGPNERECELPQVSTGEGRREKGEGKLTATDAQGAPAALATPETVGASAPERNLHSRAVARREGSTASVKGTSPPSARVAGRGVEVATSLHLDGDAVRRMLREIGLSVLPPDDLAPDGVLGHDVLHVGSSGLLGLDGQGGAGDKVTL